MSKAYTWELIMEEIAEELNECPDQISEGSADDCEGQIQSVLQKQVQRSGVGD